MWSLHISELTWRDLFSLFIPWVCKREEKLPFDDFLLFRLLLWWVEIKKKKRVWSLRAACVGCFQTNRCFQSEGGTGRTVEATGMRHQSEHISLPNWHLTARATQASCAHSRPWTCRLPLIRFPLEKRAGNEEYWSSLFIQPVIKYASINVGWLN